MLFTGLSFATEDSAGGHGEDTLSGSVSNVKIEAITPIFFLKFPDNYIHFNRTRGPFSLFRDTICATVGLLCDEAFVLTWYLYESGGCETALTREGAS